jgi:hypothetical protein
LTVAQESLQFVKGVEQVVDSLANSAAANRGLKEFVYFNSVFPLMMFFPKNL